METLDLTGLTDEEIRLLRKLADFLRNRGTKAKQESALEITYRSWPLGVKGPIAREAIYDYL